MRLNYYDFVDGRIKPFTPVRREGGLPQGHCRRAYSLYAARKAVEQWNEEEGTESYRLVPDQM